MKNASNENDRKEIKEILQSHIEAFLSETEIYRSSFTKEETAVLEEIKNRAGL